MRYYKPKKEELVQGMELELYYEDSWNESSWNKFKYDEVKHDDIPLDDLRVKYLDTSDLNSVGIMTNRVLIGTQTQIKDILLNGTEITEEVDIWSEELLTLTRQGIPLGLFYPFKPEGNLKIKDKEYTIKNLTELKKLFDES